MKKFISLLATLLIGYCAMAAWPGTVQGTGIEADPYRITTAQELADLAAWINAGNGTADAGKHYRLTANLDLSGWGDATGWVPIGTNTTPFRGLFHGDGHSISNLKINRAADYQGLFGYMGNGVLIERLILQNVNIVTGGTYGGRYVAALSGYAVGATISDCYVDGKISSTSNSGLTRVAGLVGFVETSSTVKNCFSACDVTGYDQIAGIVAVANASTVTSCYSSGSIVGSYTVGGVIGYGQGATNATNCYNIAIVRGTVARACGIESEMRSGYLRNSFAACLFVDGNNDIGRVAPNSSALSNNYALNTMALRKLGAPVSITSSSHTSRDGADKTKEELQQYTFYTTPGNWYNAEAWSISNEVDATKIWNIWDGNSYPYFQWQAAASAIDSVKMGIVYGRCKPNEIPDSLVMYRNGSYVSAILPNVDGSWSHNFGAVAEKSGTIRITAYTQGFAPSYPAEYFGVDSIRLAKRSIVPELGDTLSYTIYPLYATNKKVYWRSGDASIVNVAANGKLTKVSRGSAFVYAATADGNLIDSTLVTYSFCDGTGTAANPLLICDTAALAALARTVNAGTDYSGKHFRLTANLDLSGWGDATGWVPIGTGTNPFKGIFHGGGKTIRNLSINRSGVDYQGLFGCINGAVIDSLGVENVNIVGNKIVGGVAGEVSNSSAITHSYSSGSISGAGNNVGGVAGYVSNSTITHNYSHGSISGTDYVGGVAGCVTSSSSITQSYSSGSINGNNSVGGVAGYVTSNSFITQSYSSGSISGAARIGGVVGYVYNISTITQSYSSGSISGNDKVGGVAGEVSNSTIKNCVALNPSVVTTANTTAVNRIAGNNASSTFANNYALRAMVLKASNKVVTRNDDATVNGIAKSLDTLQSFAFYSTASNWNTQWSIANGTDNTKAWNIWDGKSNLYLQTQSAPVWNAEYITTAVQFNLRNNADSVTAYKNGVQQTASGALLAGANTISGLSNLQKNDTITLLVHEANKWVSYPVQAAISFCGGEGTVADPYLICDTAALAALARKVNAGTAYSGVHFRLTANLDLAGWGDATGWVPIGGDVKRFGGIFHGGGKAIRNLSINRTTSNYQGLFGYISGATIDSLGVENVKISGGSYVGGVAGEVYKSTITHSYSSGSISGSYYVGGVAGDVITNSSITQSSSSSSISGKNSVGGVAGEITNSSTITHSYSSGSISGSDKVGGVAGWVGYSDIKNCVALNPSVVATSSTTIVNRIAGYNSGGNYANNYALRAMVLKASNKVVTRNDDATVNGIAKSLDTLQSFTFYSTIDNWDAQAWDIANGTDNSKAWNIWDGKSNPYFQWQSAPVWNAEYGTTVVQFDLRNNADSVAVYKNGARQTASGALSVGTNTISGLSNLQKNDAITLLVYEANNWVSYPVQAVAVSFCDGFGTAEYPYLICDTAALATLARNVNAGTAYSGVHFRLTANLDLSGWGDATGWVPIGTNANRFKGIFHGGGKSIRNLSINRTTSDYQGLFGYIQSAAIDSLGVENVNIVGQNYVGGVAGRVASSTITHSHSSGSISGAGFVGGVAGVVNSSTITHSYSSGSISGTDNYVGGVAGDIYSNSTITHSYSSGSISGYDNVGGVAGYVYSSSTITHSYSSGSISGYDNVGGVAGYVNSSTIKNCVALNPSVATTSNTFAVNRIAGSNSGGNYANNYAINSMVLKANGSVLTRNDDATVNGAAKSLEILQSYAFYSTLSNWETQDWSIANGTDNSKAWNIWDSKSNPYFQWQSAPVWNAEYGTTVVQFNLRNNADSVTVYKNGVRQTASGALPIGTNILSGLGNLQKTDTITLLVYEASKWVSYPVQAVISFCGGLGTAEYPYLICDTAALANLAHYVNAGTAYSGVHFRLTANLDLSGWGDASGWVPIGTNANRFKGIFHGGGKSIRNLSINRTTSDYQGLFGAISSATIDSVGVENVNIVGQNQVGGVAGEASNSSTITHSHSSGSISGNFYAGGVTGYVGSSTITYSYSSGSVSGYYFVGGVAGGISFSSSITHSYSSGSISGTGNSTGGIVGHVDASSITHSYSSGGVSGKNAVGGVAGTVISPSNIKNCVALNPSIAATNAVNRIVGNSNGSNSYANNYALRAMALKANGNAVTRSDDATVNGTAKFLDTLQNFAFYSTAGNWETQVWDIASGIDNTKAWNIWDGKSYPYLQYQAAPVKIENITASSISGKYKNVNSGAEKPDSIVVFKNGVHLNKITNHSNGSWSLAASVVKNDTITAVAYKAGFAPSYPVSKIAAQFVVNASAGAGGNILPAGDSSVFEGSNIAYTITPGTGYTIDSVIVNNVYRGKMSGYTFANVQGDSSIRAVFRLKTFTVSASANSGGTISPLGDSVVNYGSNIAYTIAPSIGCQIDSVIVNGKNREKMSGYTFANVQGDSSIRAVFKLKTFTVSASANSGGTISPNGDSTVVYGNNIAYTIAPSTGYTIDSVIVNGVNKGKLSAYTFGNIQGDSAIRAVFVSQGPPAIFSLEANGSALAPVDNNRYVYTSGCAEPSVALNIIATGAVTVGGQPYTPGMTVSATVDTALSIVVTNSMGSSTYSLQIAATVSAASVYIHRFANTVAIINNPANNGGYRFTNVVWYNAADTEVAQGGVLYLPQGAPVSGYYAMVEFNSAYHNVCGSIPDAVVGGLSVHPNPAAGNVTVTVGEEKVGREAVLYSLYGVAIQKIKLTQVTSTLNVSTCAPGIYYLKVADETVTVVVKE